MPVVSRNVFRFPALLFVLLTGCPNEPDKSVPVDLLPFAGQKIRIGVPTGMGLPTLWEGPLNEWAAQTGASYTLTELPAGDPSQTLAAFSGNDHQTLTIFSLDQAGPLVGAGSLAAIPVSLLGAGENKVGWSDLFAGLSTKLATKKESALFVPLSCPVLVCYYRQDLLFAAGLNPPHTWDDYQQLLDKLESWAPGFSAVEPWSDDFRATMFLARAVSHAQNPAHYSLFFDIETGAPLIHSPGFVRALEVAVRALEKMPKEVLASSPSDCRNAIVRGQAALAIAFESPATRFSLDAEPTPASAVDRPADGAIGFVRLPGTRETYNLTRQAWEASADKGVYHVTLCGFGGLAIAAATKNSPLQTEAGWNALIRICGPSLLSGFPAGMTGLCRESQMQSPAALVGADLDGVETAAYAEAVARSLRDSHLVAELPVTGRYDFRGALSQELAGAIAGSQSAEHALHEVGRQWRAIVERIGPATIRDNYRANLGLVPLGRRK